MIQAISLSRIIEELVYETETAKKLTGSFRSTESLISSAGLLQQQHSGLFAFFAFHASQDPPVRDYIESQSVGDDAGKHIMVLILSSKVCTFAEDWTSSMLVGEITMDRSINPAYELAERFFPETDRPVLPGLLLFDTICDVSSALYIGLEHCDTARQVGNLCRRIFVLVEQVCQQGKPEKWLDHLSSRLAREKVAYRRTGARSMREWLSSAFGLTQTIGVSLVALVPKVLGKLLGL